jgi:uncharacterized protein (TIGR02145 family)
MRLVITDKPILFHAASLFASVRYGYLYNRLSIEDERGITAPGSHVATLAEWEALRDFIASDQEADPTFVGGYVKENSLIYWNTPNTGANNFYLFNARGNGIRFASGSFAGIKNNCRFHSSDVDNYGGDNRSGVGFLYNSDTFSFIYAADAPALNNTGMGIRIIKNTTDLADGQSGTYTGNDGKVYPTICIGGVEWLACNLAESQYRTGDIIPLVQANADWAALSAGARCIYDDNLYYLGDKIEDPEGTLPLTSSDIEIVTTKAGLFTIYLAGTGSTIIDWNDGSTTNVTLTGSPVAYNHSYTAGGTVTIANGSTITHISALTQSITSCEISANCIALENIELNGNSINVFETHAEWVNLSVLYLNGNELDSLTTHPEWINMTYIDVGNNTLTSIICHPEWVSIYTINIQANQIDSFVTHPEWTNLAEFYCENNNLTALTTYSAWDIEDFNVSGNNLTSLIAHPEWANIYFFTAQNMALTEIVVNNILIALETAGIGIDAGDEVSLDGGTNAAPTGSGATAKANMIALGALVLTN